MKNFTEALRAGNPKDVQRQIEMLVSSQDLFHSILTNEETVKKAEKLVAKRGDGYLAELEAKFAEKDIIGEKKREVRRK